jgi:DNA-binding TFAR19-related protein (PDSD5 family)
MTLAYFDTVFAFAVVMLLLSLFITVLVQLVISIRNLRGRSLLWGIEQILNSHPGLRAHAKTIAEKVLKHRSISHGGRLAKAIGSEELKSILKEIYSEFSSSDKEDDQTLLNALTNVFPTPIARDENRKYLAEFINQFEKLFPQEMTKVDSAVRIFEEKASGLMLNIDTWFDTVMRRTSEHFLLRIRFWTILFASVVTLTFNVDSLKLLQDISTNSGLRETLISSANRTLEKAEEVLYVEPIASSAIKSIKVKHPEELAGDIPSNLVSMEDGEEWIKKNVKDEDQKKVLESYHNAYDISARQRLGTVMKQAKDLRSDLEKSQLTIVPAHWLWDDWRGWRHLIGLLMTMAFLSLGAPFWFNALQGLSALRPTIAGKVDPSKQEKTS